jgi:hypothetical protein
MVRGLSSFFLPLDCLASFFVHYLVGYLTFFSSESAIGVLELGVKESIAKSSTKQADMRLLEKLAQCYIEVEEDEKAIKVLYKVLEQNPRNATCWMAMAQLLSVQAFISVFLPFLPSSLCSLCSFLFCPDPDSPRSPPTPARPICKASTS